MNNWCICWFFTHILLGILIFKGLTARRLYKSFGVKGLIHVRVPCVFCYFVFMTNICKLPHNLLCSSLIFCVLIVRLLGKIKNNTSVISFYVTTE
jgi:hypothetical protein